MGKLVDPNKLLVSAGTMYSSDTCDAASVRLCKNSDGLVPVCLSMPGWLNEFRRVTLEWGPLINTSSTRL